MSDRAEILQVGIFDLQVCVPVDWSDKEVEEFANKANPAGTAGGWKMLEDDDPLLDGDPLRNPCGERSDYVHIRLEC
jgi:hypothetical protein